MIIDIYEYFKKHPTFNKRMGNNYLLVEYQCPINVEMFQLWSKSHLITYVIRGEKDWITPSETIHLTSGDAIFVKKGVYTTRQYQEEDYCVMLFFLNDDFIRNFVISNGLRANQATASSDARSVVNIHTDGSFKSLIDSIFHYLKLGNSIPQDLVDLKFSELLYNITLNPANDELSALLLDISNGVKMSIEYIMRKNFQYDLSLEAFARLCGRSLSSFKRDFKDHFDQTPAKWLIRKRLELAKSLLLSSQLNINQVCDESGFKNTSHFVKTFKQHFDFTPAQYRDTHLKV